MSLSPDLVEETASERAYRESITGELGNGLKVQCRPYLDDPEVVHEKDRAICLVRPYEACKTCPHRLFTLVFDPHRKVEMAQPIYCPRWENEMADRSAGKQPNEYVLVPLGTCRDVRPMSYCGSCPSQESLVQLGINKAVSGWFRRYSKYREEEFLDG